MPPLIPAVAQLASGLFTVVTTTVTHINKQKIYSDTVEINKINRDKNNRNEEALNNKMKSFVWVIATIILGLFFWR